jgi:hypothetical protein
MSGTRPNREVAIGDRPGEERPRRRDDVFAGMTSAAAVTPRHRRRSNSVFECFDIGRQDLIEAPVAQGYCVFGNRRPELGFPGFIGLCGGGRGG